MERKRGLGAYLFSPNNVHRCTDGKYIGVWKNIEFGTMKPIKHIGTRYSGLNRSPNTDV